jgi:hypothetical protein
VSGTEQEFSLPNKPGGKTLRLFRHYRTVFVPIWRPMKRFGYW